jgi:hypothetical protein
MSFLSKAIFDTWINIGGWCFWNNQLYMKWTQWLCRDTFWRKESMTVSCFIRHSYNRLIWESCGRSRVSCKKCKLVSLLNHRIDHVIQWLATGNVFLFSVSRPALEPTQLPVWWVLGLRWWGHEADHSLTSSAKVKIGGALPPLLQNAFMAQCLIN